MEKRTPPKKIVFCSVSLINLGLRLVLGLGLKSGLGLGLGLGLKVWSVNCDILI